MNIDDRLIEILKTTFPKWSVLTEDWFGADEAIHKKRPPYAVYLLPTGGQIIMQNGRTRDAVEIGVAFLTNVPHDANGEENIKALNEMKLAARQFVQAINASGHFDPVFTYEYNTIYEELADITTGVLLTASVRELRGEC